MTRYFDKVAPTDDAKVGLNPKLLERNKYLHSARMAHGGKLTQAEYNRVCEDFSKTWDSLENPGNFKETYDAWRIAPGAASVAPKRNRYHCMWGGGSTESPLSPKELFDHVREVGWPKDDEVFDVEGQQTSVAASHDIDFAVASDYQPNAIGRLPKNVDRDHARSLPQFEMIESGLLNIIAKAGKEAAESATLMYSLP